MGKGILPREAAEQHAQNATNVLKNSLKKAKIRMKNVDIIAVALGAGLPPCLRVGATFARYLALKYNKPLIPVCHQIAHIEIGKLKTGLKDPVVLYLSGGNTQVIAFVEGKYRIFGETEDIPIGNALDMLARKLGLSMPGGPQIEILAKGGEWTNFSYVVKGMDASFSGLVTEGIKKFESGLKKEDICYSFQETCFAMLTEITERAMAHTDKQELLLVGGVAVNKRLQEMLRIMCEDRKAKMYIEPEEYAGDCGVNVAWVGILAHKSGVKSNLKNRIHPKWRTDEVKITWLSKK